MTQPLTPRATEQLEKVLALADSNHEGEALGALRMLRRLLAREGLSFGDLLRSSKRAGFSFRPPLFTSAMQAQLEAQIEQLQDDLDAHVEQNASLSAQLAFWRQRAVELEQALNLNQAETLRWKDMARETAERLWDIGQLAHEEALASDGAARGEEDDEENETSQEALKATG